MILDTNALSDLLDGSESLVAVMERQGPLRLSPIVLGERRAVKEGLSQDELAIFDLLKKENLSKRQRESVKRASKQLLESVLAVIAASQDWTAKESTKAEVEELISQEVFTLLPTPPFDEAEKVALAGRVYQHVWQQSNAGNFGTEAA